MHFGQRIPKCFRHSVRYAQKQMALFGPKYLCFVRLALTTRGIKPSTNPRSGYALGPITPLLINTPPNNNLFLIDACLVWACGAVGTLWRKPVLRVRRKPLQMPQVCIIGTDIPTTSLVRTTAHMFFVKLGRAKDVNANLTHHADVCNYFTPTWTSTSTVRVNAVFVNVPGATRINTKLAPTTDRSTIAVTHHHMCCQLTAQCM